MRDFDLGALTAYLEGLTVTQGPKAGERLEVLPWQRRFLRGAYREGVEVAALSVARGNGKSTYCSGIAAATIEGPLVEPRAETVLVASAYRQAKIDFDHALAFLRPTIDESPGRFRITDNAQQAMIVDRLTGASIRAIGSDAKRAHGLAPQLVLADEPAQWQGGGAALFAALVTSMGKIEGAKVLCLGTRPADEQHWFSRLLAGGADYSQTHAARLDDPPFQMRTIRRANPSVDAMPNLLATIRREGAKAKRDPGLFAAYAALRLNLGTPDTEREHLLEPQVWRECESDSGGRAGPLVWGVDLGGSAASSAIVAYWPETYRLEALAAFPSEPSLSERGARDGVGGLYLDMARRGELLTLGGRAIPVPELLGEALTRWGAPDAVVADRWREGELRDGLSAAMIPPAALILRGMGYRDGGEDVRHFRRACLAGRVLAPESLLMRSALAGARTLSDPAGNAKLAKGSEGGRKQNHRDDAAAAAILAVAEGERARAAPQPSKGSGIAVAG